MYVRTIHAALVSLFALLFVACGDGDPFAPAALEPQAPAELEPTAPAELATAAPLDLLTLDGLACTGHWLDRNDAGTRLQAHPDTGVCTLPCQIVGPLRNTCTPIHRAKLAALCAELGGACTVASDGFSYCEAQ